MGVRLDSAHVVELRAVGFIQRAHVVEAQRALGEIFATDAGPYRLLWDATALEGYEPGLPAQWVRWLLPRLAHVRETVSVTRSPGVFALIRALRVLVPRLPQGVFHTREEALLHLRRAEGEVNGSPARRAARR